MFENLNAGSIPKRAGRWTTERRLGIVRAAAAAFRRHGFAATGMREIAREAELSAANLYYYFSGKDELIYFCQDFALDRMLAAAAAAQRSEAAPRERLARVLEAQVRCMLEELDGALAHLEVDALPPDLRRRIVRKRDRYEKSVRAIVTSGIRSGAFRQCNAALVTRAMLGAVNWTARWYRPRGPSTPTEVASAFSEYLVRGLLR